MFKNWIRITAMVASLTLASFAMAAGSDVGKAIFVFGKANVVAVDGSIRALAKGGALTEGDRIVTGANGRVQIRMADGGLLALRPATEFVIERFRMAGAGNDPSSSNEEASFFALVKGGFRSITGAIGKQNKDAYRVRTAVATIGIRGTDYDALLCAADCQTLAGIVGKPVQDGLYVGVNSGGVRLANDKGFVDLDVNDFGFAGGANKAPGNSPLARQLLAPATQARANRETAQDAEDAVAQTVAAPDTGVTADDNGDVVDFNTGVTTSGKAGAVAYANLPGAGVGVSAADGSNQGVSADGVVTGFDVDDTSYDIGSAQSFNVGRDDARAGATGLSWGRWSDGAVNATDSLGSVDSTIDGSTHWIAADGDTPTPQLPVSGSQSFDLIGNTDPTDNNGNVGTLGSASLDANFDAQTVDADVSLSFAQTNQVWDASARDVDINSGDATFDGAFDDVTISDGTNSTDGSGSLSGFFTGDQDGDVNGAGLTYGLTDDAGTDVAGSAAFQASPGSP